MDVKSESINIDSGSDENLTLRQAIKNQNKKYIKSWLENGMDVNAPVITKGPFAGFTILHLICMEKDCSRLMYMLVRGYKADLNVMADDGVQPIHLAILCEVYEISCLLRKENVNATIKREFFLKYAKRKDEWCPDFGDEMTLLTYAIIYKREYVGQCLVRHGANVDIISLTNQSLIMYAIDKHVYHTYMEMAKAFSENSQIPSIVNYRDTDGVPISHYPLHPKLFGEFRYDDIYEAMWTEGDFIKNIILAGADKYALINNDPATFLPNLAAYRGFPEMLTKIFHIYESIDQSRALYYATLPIDENADNYLRSRPQNNEQRRLEQLRTRRKECVEVIIIELINRITFGSPVPEEEKKIMDNLIATDTSIKEYVEDYEKNIINGIFKKFFIEVNNKELSFFDLCVQMFSRRKLNILAKSLRLRDIYRAYDLIEDLFNTIKTSVSIETFYNWRQLLGFKLKYAQKRLQLVEKLRKVTQLRDAVPLPYELVLDMVEYLNNAELKTFIAAFRYP